MNLEGTTNNTERKITSEIFIKLLQSLTRQTRWESVSDPIAQEIIKSPKQDINQITDFLSENGITELTLLKDGYGTSAVVLDAGEKVVRLSTSAYIPQPDLPQIKQPVAVKQIGSLNVRILEKLNLDDITQKDVENMQMRLAEQGYRWDDAGTDNLGRDREGNLFIIDGAVVKL